MSIFVFVCIIVYFVFVCIKSGSMILVSGGRSAHRVFTLRLQFENPPTAPASICHSLPQFATVCYDLLQFVTVCYSLLRVTVATKTTEHFKKPSCVKDSILEMVKNTKNIQRRKRQYVQMK